MTLIHQPNGLKPRYSCNLRGIRDYARTQPITRVELRLQDDAGAYVTFIFYNGAWSVVRFASYSVAFNWIKSRRSWGKCRIKELDSAQPGIAFVY